MRRLALLCFGFFLGSFCSASLYAFYPVDGWWFDPAEGGRGFNIEMQDDEMFISAFHYRNDGSPVWWVANGTYNDSTGRVNGEFLELNGGQCPGCPYTGFPEIVQNAGSPVTIEFHSPVTATLSWDGESISLVRQYWRFSLDDLNSFLYGEFHFTSGALGVYFGDRLYFNEPFTGSDGTSYAAGGVRGGSSSRVALAQFNNDLGLFFILVDTSAEHYKSFVFDMTKDRLEGESEVWRKSEEPTGSGLPFVGHRVASRSYVTSGIGPHEAQQLQRSSEPDLEREASRIRIMTQETLRDAQWENGASKGHPEPSGLSAVSASRLSVSRKGEAEDIVSILRTMEAAAQQRGEAPINSMQQ